MPIYLDIHNIEGLTAKQAEERLEREGYNELPQTKRKNVLLIAFEVVREPMFLLLTAAGFVYFLLGDMQEALMLLSFVFVVMTITFYQERKTERALEALRNLASPRASVIRDGKKIRIPGREVVRGDILVISEGDRVAGDGVLLSGENISVDESLLTGESVPVGKVIWDGKTDFKKPGGDGLPFIYSGTLVVKGQGIAEVKRIAFNTEIGKIGKALETLIPSDTPLQKETRRVVVKLALLGLFLCLLVVIIYGITRADWFSGFLAGLALAMAMLPEEFPVVLTVFLALGAWRISKKRVLTRQIPAIEALGAATILCVDKTGTLTQNRMTVEKIYTKEKVCPLSLQDKKLPENFHETVEFAILASQKDPFDPMEKALKKVGADFLLQTKHLHSNWTLLREYPLSKSLLALSHVWQSPSGEEFIIAAKGSPEAIFDLCHLSEKKRQKLYEEVHLFAREGLRVIGVAKAYFGKIGLPKKQHDFNFEFLGLLGLADPIRDNVRESLLECYNAGIRVVMITGDYPVTAQSIGRKIGLKNTKEFVTGEELSKISERELRKRIETVNIFARVAPEQKLLLVKALKKNGEIVAMTGDGVNDAPALKASHIGIAMGGRGTDVAREAAELVVLDDDFSSIVAAVRLGRRIFDNIKKACAYILAIHVPIAGLSIIPILFNFPLILAPVHIVFLELIIDPSCSIVFENEKGEEDIMSRPPRSKEESLFSKKTLGISILQGLVVLFIVLSVYIVSLLKGLGEVDSRTLTFTTLVIANLGLILTNLSWSTPILETVRRKNQALWWVSGGAVLFLALVLSVPFLRHLFHFSTLHLADLLIAFSAGLLSIAWFEGFKLLKTIPSGR